MPSKGVNGYSPGEKNMSPKNQWLEDVLPIDIHSPFLWEHVSFWGCKSISDMHCNKITFDICFGEI